MLPTARRGLAAALTVVAVAISLCACTALSKSPTASPIPTSTTAVAPITPPVCPAIRKAPPVRTPGTPAKPILTFAPTYLVACRYSVLPNAGKLLGSATVESPARVAVLQREIESFSALPPGVGISCPADFGGSIDVYVGDTSRQVELTIDTSGCRFMSGPGGGYHAVKGDHLYPELNALTK